MSNERTVVLGYKNGKRHEIDFALKDTPAGPALSISAAIWQQDMKDVESCGQIVSEVVAEMYTAGTNSPGITLEWLRRVEEVWKRWHLNNMRASCEHQRDWRAMKKIVLVTYRLRSELHKQQQQIEQLVLSSVKLTGSATINGGQAALLTLPWEVVVGADQPAPGPEYVEQFRKTKTAGWVTPSEHPDGLLAKPCLSCGHKYGTKWLHEPLPADVLEFVQKIVQGVAP